MMMLIRDDVEGTRTEVSLSFCPLTIVCYQGERRKTKEATLSQKR